ncbi:MAG: sialidase family protein [Myxococcales bacterium]
MPLTNGAAATTPPDVAGATQTLLAHPTDPNILYAGTVNGGVWRTTNARAAQPSWTPMTDFLPSMSIFSLAMDATNAQVVVAGTGRSSSFGFVGGLEGRILSSRDGGSTWSVIDNAVIRDRALTGLAIRGSLLLAGSNAGGVFRSTDSGVSWTNLVGAPSSGLPGTLGAAWHLLADPSSATRYYLVASGGLFRSSDAGVTWTNIATTDTAVPGTFGTRGLPLTLPTSDNAEMAIAPDGRVWVAVATVGEVVYVGNTANQGTTWTRLDQPRFPTGSSASPGAPAAISSASNTSPIVITTPANHGLDANTLVNSGALRVRIAGIQGNTAANGDWVARAAPPATPGGPPPTNKFILVDPVTFQSSVGNGAYVVGTGTWQQWFSVNPGGQSPWHLSIAADPTNSSVVYVGGDSGFGFTGSGSFTTLVRGNAAVGGTAAIPSPQWAHIMASNAVSQIPGGGTANSTSPHADSRKMVFDAAGELIEACDGGVFRRTSPRTNAGDWFTMNGLLNTLEFHDIAIDPVSGLLFGGIQDNGTAMQSVLTSLPWNEFEGADGGDVKVSSLGTQSIRYTSAQGLGDFRRATFDSFGNQVGSFVNPALVVIGSSPPKSIYKVDTGLPFVTRFATNPASAQRIVIGGSQTVWESFDQGATIKSLGAAGNANDLDYGLLSNPDALWVATGTGVFVRLTASGTLAATVPAFPGGGAVDVAMSRNDATTAYAINSFQVFVTTVGTSGRIWTDITGDLSQQQAGSLRSVLHIPSASGDRLVVGTDTGVFVTSATTPGFWSKIAPTTLPNVLVFDLDYDASRDLLVAGTMGRGAWTIPGASQLNRAPIARCQNVTVSANAMCVASVPASSINAGSNDPDGDPITLAAVPGGPYGRGPTLVTLTVQDNRGASSTCTATVTVVDTTPPVFNPVADITRTLCDPAGEVLALTVPTATDNCVVPTVTGQVVASSDPTLTVPINIINGRVTLSAGNFTIAWTASDGVNTTTIQQHVSIRAGIFATQSLTVLDRNVVRLPSGALATLLNSGTGTTTIGTAAQTGDILRRGPVVIGDRAIIDGSIRSGSKVFLGSGVTVNGNVTENQAIAFPPALIVTPNFPSTNVGSVTIQPDQTVALAPNSYNQVIVNSRATAALRTGTYFFNVLGTIEPQAVLSLNQTGGPILLEVRNTLTWRGNDILAGGTFAGFTLAYFGTAGTTLESPFTGILVAPNGPLTLGSAGGGQTFTGQFYAGTLATRPDVTIVCRGDF